MAGIIINPRARIFHGHCWVYSSEIKKTFGNPVAGDVITMKDFKDRPLGSAIYNPNSQIVARRFARRKQDLDRDFFHRRISQAAERREGKGAPGVDPKLCRLVWSESDGLPGLVVDRYGDHLVVQTLTLAMDMRIGLIAEVLGELFSPRGIVARNDASVRVAEGLESEVKMLAGDEPEPFRVTSGGLSFLVDLMAGQKTGLYLDQLGNYGAVAEMAQGKRVLDCFTNQGGFALACARAGAASVTAVDSSAPALANAAANAEAIGLGEKVSWVEANVFDYLKEAESNEERYDLIILDPPSFTRSKRSVKDAMRGYKEIHLRALKMLEPGGRLATYTCSHHVGRPEFLEMLGRASVDAKRSIRQAEVHTQRADHPIVITVPETEYLKGVVVEVIPSW
jgi:23S rRNA (cytosine1962-C5)-methyltransferase